MGVDDTPGPLNTRYGGRAASAGPAPLVLALGSTAVLVAASVLGMVLAFAEKYP